jgi:hypothetical protein
MTVLPDQFPECTEAYKRASYDAEVEYYRNRFHDDALLAERGDTPWYLEGDTDKELEADDYSDDYAEHSFTHRDLTPKEAEAERIANMEADHWDSFLG